MTGLIVNGVTENEYVIISLEMMARHRQLVESGDPLFDRTHAAHLEAIARRREVEEIRADHDTLQSMAKAKQEAHQHVGDLLGIYDAKTGKFEGEPRWVKESRRFSYVVNPKTGRFIDHLEPVVSRINREMELAAFPGPSPLDMPGIRFDPSLGDVEVVLPAPMVKSFLAETDALAQRMAEKSMISIEAVRLTDRDIVAGTVARLGADLLGVHNVSRGFSQQGVLRRIGINALTAIANQQLQIQQLNQVAAGSWPAATPLVGLDPVPLPPLEQARSFTSVGGDFSVGANPIFLTGGNRPSGSPTWTRTAFRTRSGSTWWTASASSGAGSSNLIVHRVRKDPSVPPTKYTVPVGPASNTFDGLAALISQEDQNLIVATGTSRPSARSARRPVHGW